MKNLQEKFNLTELESKMLSTIVSFYDEEDILCFQEKLSQSEKGIIGSLIKKDLVYDSTNGIDKGNNFFPNWNVLEFLELN